MMGRTSSRPAASSGVDKLVAACSVCAYPKYTPVPFKEDDDLERLPRGVERPYGLAKKMLIVLSDAYRRQYGLDSCAPVIANLYGPDDNFDLEDSHVIAAMIHKYVEAAGERRAARSRSGAPASPRASSSTSTTPPAALILAAERLDDSEPFNVGTGRRDADPRPRRDDRER